MNIVPTRNQWKNWSLPSKLTALGLLATIMSIAIFLVDKTFQDDPARIVQELQALRSDLSHFVRIDQSESEQAYLFGIIQAIAEITSQIEVEVEVKLSGTDSRVRTDAMQIFGDRISPAQFDFNFSFNL